MLIYVIESNTSLLAYSLAELTELKMSCNSEWRDTGVWSLIAPFLKYLDDGMFLDSVSHAFISVLIILQKYLIEQRHQKIH
jgi:uncharacterized membrane protein YjjP (DUF1212 family)